MLEKLKAGTLEVLTDALASPTGFPFEVVQLDGTPSDPAQRAARPRLCDLGYLRTAFLKDDGKVGYRCAAEPIDMFIKKGGTEADTVGRACLCNALSADIGLGQTPADGYQEEVLVTLGADLDGANPLIALHPEGWSADQALDWLLAPV